MNKIYFALLFCISVSSSAEELVAVLDLKYVKDTGKTSSLVCFGEGNTDCTSWSTFYLFKARARNVVRGELPKKFSVIFGAHALKKENHKNVVARLKKLDPESDAQYQIIEWGSKRELYCFSSEENKQFLLQENGEETKHGCYEKN